MHDPSSPTTPPVVLTIAGFDPTSGAGVTADLQVFASMGLFGTACPTALTVQSTRGVARVQAVEASLLREMLEFLTGDIPPAGIKIGMLGDLGITQVVAEFLEDFDPDRKLPIVVDPVLRSSSGTILLEQRAWDAFLQGVCHRATCLTPNREELAALVARGGLESGDVEEAAQELLYATGTQGVIVTGGDAVRPDDLLLQPGREPVWLRGDRVETSSTHGTGCAFSSVVLSRLVLGDDLLTAGRSAKSFVEKALRAAPELGSGKGPMKLSWCVGER